MTVSEQQKVELGRIAQSRSLPAGYVFRARLVLMLAEARGLFELNSSLALAPLLMRAPKGDGHPVLALPGFLAGDLGYACAIGWVLAVILMSLALCQRWLARKEQY